MVIENSHVGKLPQNVKKNADNKSKKNGPRRTRGTPKRPVKYDISWP